MPRLPRTQPSNRFVDRFNAVLARIIVLMVATFCITLGCISGMRHLLDPQRVAECRLQREGYSLDGAAVFRAIELGDALALTRLKVAGIALSSATFEGMKPFRYAVEQGRHDMLETLADLGVEPDFNRSGAIALEARALLNGSKRVADYLFRAGGNPDVEVEPGYPALTWALRSGNHEMAEFLVGHGASIERESVEGTPFAIAVMRADEAMMRRLLELGGNPDTFVEGGRPAVVSLLTRGETGLVRLLLNAGADPGLRGSDGHNLVTMAFQQRDREIFLEALSKTGTGPQRLPSGETMLETAALEADRSWMSLLLEQGADPNERSSSTGNSLWWERFQAGDPASAELLLGAGADINARDSAGQVPIDHAVEAKNFRMVRYLLSRGAHSEGNLYAALDAGRHDMARLLAANGEDVQNPASTGATLLGMMVMRSDLTGAALLMEYGARVVEEDRIEGHSLLEWALANKDTGMVQLLLEKGLDANARVTSPMRPEFQDLFKEHGSLSYYLAKDSGLTPLMLAAGSQQMEAARLLLKHGASRARYTKRNGTYPVTFAINAENLPMAQLMLGREPEMDGKHARKIVVSLNEQRARFYKGDEMIYSAPCSTGKNGYRTPRGTFVITDKSRLRHSTIYGSAMPYFMRLSGSAVGMHQGYVPGYPASHGCIRLPYNYAKSFFYTAQVGDIIEVR